MLAQSEISKIGIVTIIRRLYCLTFRLRHEDGRRKEARGSLRPRSHVLTWDMCSKLKHVNEALTSNVGVRLGIRLAKRFFFSVHCEGKG
jgi:hypothetical protein